MHARFIVAFMSLCLPAVPLAQTYEASTFQHDGFQPRFAFDGDARTRWSASFSEKVGWVQVTWDEPQTFSCVTILNGIVDLKGAPRDFDVLAGEPDTLRLLREIKGNDREGAAFDFPETTARCWRIDVKWRINPQWSPTISEVTFDRGQGTAADEAVGVGAIEVTASDKGRPGRGPQQAIDDNPQTCFESTAKKGTTWLSITYPEPHTADALELLADNEGGLGVPRDFTLEAKRGPRWVKLAAVEGSYTNRPRARFPKTSATEWRLTVREFVADRGGLRLHELQLLALGDEPWPPDVAPEIDQPAINMAIDRGVAWLSKRRHDDGNWPSRSTQEYPMGVMSLAGLALRKSGLDRDDPLLLDLVAKTAAMELKKTYSVALNTMFLRAMSTRLYNDRIAECAAFLVERQATDGGWGYPDGRSDLSNTQYALLAIKAAREAGVDVPEKTCEKALTWLLRAAQKDGGFNYVPHGTSTPDPSTGSMTGAALACIEICRAALPPGSKTGKTKRVVEMALEWLGDRFVVELNPNSGQSHYYYLYGVERVGAFYDIREIGGHAWYPMGAAHLVRWQRSDGSWHGDVIDTCFALLFLNRASVTRGF